MTGTRPIRVIICDDSELLRTALGLLLATDPGISVVGDAPSGSAAVALTHRLRPDIVIMDVRMPGLNGIEATRRIVAETPDTRVLLLTSYHDDADVTAGLRAGAAGYLLKDSTSSRLLDAVHAAAAGHSVLDPAVTAALVHRHVTSTAPDVLAVLTERERQILALVGRGNTNQEIATALFLAESTVKTYVSRLFTKLDCRDRASVIVLAHRYGLVTGEP